MLWWFTFYILLGTLIMTKFGEPMNEGDYIINVFARAISILCWPILVLAALLSVFKEVREKEEELK